MLVSIKIENNNIDILTKENDSFWGISFLKKEDNTEELALIEEHLTDEEYQEVLARIS